MVTTSLRAIDIGLHQVARRAAPGRSAARAWRTGRSPDRRRSRRRRLRSSAGARSSRRIRGSCRRGRPGGVSDRGLDRLDHGAGEAQRQAPRHRAARDFERRRRSARCAARRSCARSAGRRVADASTCSARTSRSKVTPTCCASPKPCWPASARAMRSSMSLAAMTRRQPRDDHFGEPAGIESGRCRAAAAPRRRGRPATAPVWPRSGARKTATFAAAPAFSTRSPIRTTSAVTVTSSLSSRRGGPATAALPPSAGEQRERDDDADHGRSSAHQVGGRRQHLVGGGDDLGVHLVGALRGDQVGDFVDRLDVGLFEIALLQVAEAVDVGLAVAAACRRPASR